MARCQTHFWTFNFFREEYLDSKQKRDREREIWRVDSRNRRRFGRGNSFLNGKTIPPRGATKQLGIVMSSIWRRGGWLSLPLLVLSKIVVENNARLFIRFFFRWMAIWWKSNWSDLESAKGKWKGVRRGGGIWREGVDIVFGDRQEDVTQLRKREQLSVVAPGTSKLNVCVALTEISVIAFGVDKLR